MATVRAIIWSFEGTLVGAGAGPDQPVLPIRGAEQPLRDIPARLVAFGLVSERPRAALVAALDKLGWASRFSTIVAADDDAAIDPISALGCALEALAVTPAETLVVTSAPATVAAAKALGCRVAALAGPGQLAGLREATYMVSHPGAIIDLLRLLR